MKDERTRYIVPVERLYRDLPTGARYTVCGPPLGRSMPLRVKGRVEPVVPEASDLVCQWLPVGEGEALAVA